MTEPIQLAFITLGGVIVTAIVGPLVVIVANHYIARRNEDRKKSIETIQALTAQVEALVKKVEVLEQKPQQRRRN